MNKLNRFILVIAICLLFTSLGFSETRTSYMPGHLSPRENNKFNLGNTSVYWDTLYVTTIMTGDIKMTASIAMSAAAKQYFIDASSADTFYLYHDGTDVLFVNDAGTGAFKFNDDIFLDAVAGYLTLSDGSFALWTDGSEADSVTAVHDGTNFVLTGDAATADLELIDMGLMIADGEAIYLTDDSEGDSVSITHDGTDLVITGDAATTAIELEGLELELSAGATIVNTSATVLTISEANTNIVGNLFLDATAGYFTLSDGSFALWTDGSEADSVTAVHDGTDLVITGDAATTAIELEGLELELSNGATIVNTTADTVTVTEAVTKIVGEIVVNGNMFLNAAAGHFTLSDGSDLVWTDGSETDSVTAVHDGTDLLVTGDAGTGTVKLSGLDITLENATTITTPHDDTTTITETVVKIAGKTKSTGDILGGGDLYVDGGEIILGTNEYENGCFYHYVLNKSGGSLTKGMWVIWDNTSIECYPKTARAGDPDTLTIAQTLVSEGGLNKILCYPMSIATACSLDISYWDYDGAQRDTVIMTVDDTYIELDGLVDSLGQVVSLGTDANDSLYIIAYPISPVANSGANATNVAGVIADATIADNAVGKICTFGMIDYAIVNGATGKPGEYLEAIGTANRMDPNGSITGTGTCFGILLEATAGVDTVRAFVGSR